MWLCQAFYEQNIFSKADFKGSSKSLLYQVLYLKTIGIKTRASLISLEIFPKGSFLCLVVFMNWRNIVYLIF